MYIITQVLLLLLKIMEIKQVNSITFREFYSYILPALQVHSLEDFSMILNLQCLASINKYHELPLCI